MNVKGLVHFHQEVNVVVVHLSVAIGVRHLRVRLCDNQTTTFAHRLNGRRQNVDLGPQTHGVKALTRGVQKHHVWLVMISE